MAEMLSRIEHIGPRYGTTIADAHVGTVLVLRLCSQTAVVQHGHQQTRQAVDQHENRDHDAHGQPRLGQPEMIAEL